MNLYFLIFTEVIKNGTSHLTPSKRFKHTHREKAPWNETLAFTESMNMDIWVAGTSKQLFIRSSWTETKFKKK